MHYPNPRIFPPIAFNRKFYDDNPVELQDRDTDRTLTLAGEPIDTVFITSADSVNEYYSSSFSRIIWLAFIYKGDNFLKNDARLYVIGTVGMPNVIHQKNPLGGSSSTRLMP